MGDDISLRDEIQMSSLGAERDQESLIQPQKTSTNFVKRGRGLAGFLIGFGLATTTLFSVLLLASASRNWTFSSSAYRRIIRNRASIQLVLQLLSNALALVYVAVLCSLINRATRIIWRRRGVPLNIIRFWHGLCVRSVDWNIPIYLVFPLLLFILVTAAPSAIWAGALAPVSTSIQSDAIISVAGYHATSNIKEWPSEIQSEGPVLRTTKGLFAYSVGIQMQASLLTSASSATPVNGTVRQHAKLDGSRYTYFGRSYGVGASVGLTDDALQGNDLLLEYYFQEVGYNTAVQCSHNSSSDF